MSHTLRKFQNNLLPFHLNKSRGNNVFQTQMFKVTVEVHIDLQRMLLVATCTCMRKNEMDYYFSIWNSKFQVTWLLGNTGNIDSKKCWPCTLSDVVIDQTTSANGKFFNTLPQLFITPLRHRRRIKHFQDFCYFVVEFFI